PINRQRRFVPIRLDNIVIPETLQQFFWLDWRTNDDAVYKRLLQSCRRTANDSLVSISKGNEDELEKNDPESSKDKPKSVPRELEVSHNDSEMTSGIVKIDSNFLQNFIYPASATLEGHTRGVWTVAISNDNSFLASGSWDKTIKIWNVSSGKCTATLEGHSDNVLSIVVSNDNSFLASGSWDKTIKIWNVSSSKCTATLEGHTNLILSIFIG
ncbi:MAG: hypothetical protein EOO88_53235, partial [Pedobacter sp.]